MQNVPYKVSVNKKLSITLPHILARILAGTTGEGKLHNRLWTFNEEIALPTDISMYNAALHYSLFYKVIFH